MPCRGPSPEEQLAYSQKALDAATRAACDMANAIEKVEQFLNGFTEVDLSQETRDWIREHKELDLEHELEDIREDIYCREKEIDKVKDLIDSNNTPPELRETLEEHLERAINNITRLKNKEQELITRINNFRNG